MSDSWPPPPREPGPWGGGPPVQPPGNTPLPPLPGPGGVSRTSAPATNPWADQAPGFDRQPFPGLTSPPAKVDRAPRALVALAALVVVGLVAGGGYIAVKGRNNFPSNWDPRVEPIAEWVAQERNLDFDHPVDVLFLTAEEYREASGGGGDDESVEETDESELEDTAAQLRALGFLEGEVDLGAANDTLNDAGTLAFYDPGTKKVYVRGTELTPSLRVTLAHELVHVLQDQNFDLTRVADLPESRGTVLRALAEGDAGRVEDAYVADVLTDAERTAYEEASAAEGEEASGELDEKVPPIMTALFSSPYVFGPVLIQVLDQEGGDDAIDGALEEPPTEEVLFDPLVLGTPAAKPEEVSVEAPEGSETIDDGDFGPTAWYLLLASRLSPTVALEAALGLGGDAYVVYKQDEKVCVRANATGDTPEDLAQLAEGLTGWVARSPETAAVEVTDDEVRFRSCDPGTEATGAGTVSTDLLVVPVTRTQVYLSGVSGGSTPAQATCFADAIVGRFTIEQLVDDTYLGTPEAQGIIEELAGTCR